MPYDFDRIIDRRQTQNLKWTAYPADVLPMFVADMDFPSPPSVIDALRAQVEHGFFGYPGGLHGTPDELASFKQLIADRLAWRHGWQVELDAISFLPGIVVAFNVACQMFRAQGGGVLVQPPIYPPMLMAPGLAGLARHDAPLTRQADGTYDIDFDQFAAAIQPDTRLFLLCNPHNPVGRVFRRAELERLAEICLSNDVLICSDEIHGDLIYRGHTHTPIASLAPEIAQRTITLLAPSKTFNLPGLQCSIAIIPNADVRARFEAAKQGLVSWLNLMGLIAGEAAYQGGQAWLDEVLIYLEGNRDFVASYIRSEMPGIRFAPPEGTYLGWLDCRAVLAGDPYEFFLTEAKVALSPGAMFGPGGEGFVRLNFACPRALLADGLDRMARALRAHRAATSSTTA